SHPRGVRRVDLELAVEHVRRDGQRVLRVRRRAIASPALGEDALQAHQARDTAATKPATTPTGLAVPARAAVGAATVGVYLFDFGRELGVALRARRRRAFAPSVEASRRDGEYLAQLSDREGHPLFLDEAKLHEFSLAKKVAAL